MDDAIYIVNAHAEQLRAEKDRAEMARRQEKIWREVLADRAKKEAAARQRARRRERGKRAAWLGSLLCMALGAISATMTVEGLARGWMPVAFAALALLLARIGDMVGGAR